VVLEQSETPELESRMEVSELDRFVVAQEPVFDVVLEELRSGLKRAHWMWFIFPQLSGLGRSTTARHYGIDGLPEARSYLDHPVLGPRLGRCVEAVVAVPRRSLHEIFGSPDDLKFRSSRTLFALASDGEPFFQEALRRYCGGVTDPATLELLGVGPRAQVTGAM
jgi:uncharacterized protein (DUF1810 family)